MKTVQRMKIILGFVLFLSLVGCVALAYLWIDRSISLSYANQSLETSINSTNRLEALLNSEWQGMPQDKVLQKLELEVKRHEVDKIIISKDIENSVIWFDEIPFYFKAGRLVQIGGSKLDTQ